ncbi:uncharacterized protein AUP68_00590 [Ilyonectria robusta]
MQILQQSDAYEVQDGIEGIKALLDLLRASEVSLNIRLEKPDSFLWLVGVTGCSKSVLCSTIIQYAFQHRRANPRIGIAIFYFTFNNESK